MLSWGGVRVPDILSTIITVKPMTKKNKFILGVELGFHIFYLPFHSKTNDKKK